LWVCITMELGEDIFLLLSLSLQDFKVQMGCSPGIEPASTIKDKLLGCILRPRSCGVFFGS
jgi:hypothetical protein